jgi:hypothetical protein
VTLSFSVVVDFFFRLKPIFSVWHFRCPPNNNNTRDAIFIEAQHASHISASGRHRVHIIVNLQCSYNCSLTFFHIVLGGTLSRWKVVGYGGALSECRRTSAIQRREEYLGDRKKKRKKSLNSSSFVCSSSFSGCVSCRHTRTQHNV